MSKTTSALHANSSFVSEKYYKSNSRSTSRKVSISASNLSRERHATLARSEPLQKSGSKRRSSKPYLNASLYHYSPTSTRSVILGSKKRVKSLFFASLTAVTLTISALVSATLLSGPQVAGTGIYLKWLKSKNRNLSIQSTNGVGDNAVRITVIAPLDKQSPYGHIAYEDVLRHIARRISWTEPGIQLNIVDAGTAIKNSFLGPIDTVTLALGIDDVALATALSKLNLPNTFIALGCHPVLDSMNKLMNKSIASKAATPATNSLLDKLGAFFSPTLRQSQHNARVLATMKELYSRHTSDDLLFSMLVLVNEAVRPVDAVSNSTKRADAGLDSVQCMISHCRNEVITCFTDSTCRTALDCMNGCAFNDQVCSYRCIASYESSALAGFSLCILQKHNCLGLSAEIPAQPNPPPMMQFGNPKQSLTHEMAEAMFIGWLENQETLSALLPQQRQGRLPSNKKERFSWRVFAGKNPAYDYFPCQFQLFYPGKAKGSLWYQPVFKVKTIDGREVWRDRLYRVRRDVTPGTFFLSVLDNGVVSQERWSILDCDNDLDWCIFYYRGAASNAGMSYTGSVLVSKSGSWPTADQALLRIENALERAGIKMWELSTVNNEDCDDAPLNLVSI